MDKTNILPKKEKKVDVSADSTLAKMCTRYGVKCLTEEKNRILPHWESWFDP